MSDQQATPVVENEIEVAMSSQIESRVQRIRELKLTIEEKENLNGINTDREEVDGLRQELLELCKSYNELTGHNWSDDAGFAQYKSPGERHSYDVKGVDEALAAIMALSGDMGQLASPKPFLLTMKVELKAANDQVITTEALVSLDAVKAGPSTPEQLVGFIEQLFAHNQKMVEEFNLRLNALDVQLKKLAGARKVSAISETVSVK